jgi:hypothetical protein
MPGFLVNGWTFFLVFVLFLLPVETARCVSCKR